MIINCSGVICAISNVSKSPYLYMLESTTMGVDRDENGNVILNLDIETFRHYVNFLNNKYYILDDDTAALFDYMGHSNVHNLPSKY